MAKKATPSAPNERTTIDTARLLSQVDIVALIDRYVPLAKSGAEYEACCPFHSETTPSFKVSPAKQFYHCFGCGANGDAIKFLREYCGLGFVDAVRALGGDAGEAQPGEPPPQRDVARPEKKPSDWKPILPVPTDAPEPPKAHIKRGRPERTWCYRDAQGRVLGYTYRFLTSNGGKEVLPFTWCHNEASGKFDWHGMAFPEPRPLYGLERLAARPDATVLLVEGEKCADAGDAELDLAVVSWPGGGKAVKKIDWSPLAGRKVILWPDCDAKRVPLSKEERDALPDLAVRAAAQAEKPLLPECEQPGMKAMTQIAERLQAQNCRLWFVQIPAPGEKLDGWDIADAIDEGLRSDALSDYIRANLRAPAQAVQGEAGTLEDSESVSPPTNAGAGSDDGGSGNSRGGNGGFGGRDGSWRALLLRKDDKLIDCRENVFLMLAHHPAWEGVLAADAFARRVVKRKPAPWGGEPGEWEENDNLRLGLWLAQQERLLVRSTENLGAAVSWLATDRQFHPVRDYLDAQVWDGTSRLDDWLCDHLGVRKTAYSMLAGRLFLIGMVARIYKPGCPMRAMPILEGGQYQGKSTAMRILGGEFFGDTPIDLNNKDAYQLIQGRWLYEIAELDAFNRAETTRIKSFISSPEDRFRAPYERMPRDWPRQTVFVGTTNQDEYFKDQTGNTRYWPLRVMEVGLIELDALYAVRDQLFAEALVCFRRGDRWHPTREEQQTLFEPEQEDREVADPWQQIIANWLRKSVAEKVTTTEILFECLKIEAGKIDGTRSMSTRIGTAMKRLGWHKRRQAGGAREYYYLRPEGWGKEVVTAGGLGRLEGIDDVAF